MQLDIQANLTHLTSASDIFAALLHGLGLKTREEMTNFLKPPAPTLPKLIEALKVPESELNHAKAIINHAIASGRDICVFGDYDADGVTSTAILWQALRHLARGTPARIMPFIPDRHRHGYGLSSQAAADIQSGQAFAGTAHPDFNPTLIITVDNGIVANEVVQDLISSGVEVIITDHHQPGVALPAASAVIHTLATSGAGVAWLTALYCTESADFVTQMVDLASVGIVADQLPLTGINRSLVVAGLKQLAHTGNCGLQTLIDAAGIGGRPLTTYDINYVLAPRLNAVGRLADPMQALRLLCSNDVELARKLTSTIETLNTQRQELTEKSLSIALSLAPDHKVMIVESPDFHEGIIGLVASKMAEFYNRPSLVISRGPEISKGSARSVGSINITSLLREQADLLLGVGGHPMAAGFSLRTADLPRFISRMTESADRTIQESDLAKTIRVDGELELSQLTKSLAQLLSALEPFGIGNPKPRFLVRDLEVLEDRVVGKQGNHRKLVVAQGSTTRDVIWFNGNMPHPVRRLRSIVFNLEINVWRDRESVQLNAQYVEPV